MKILRCRKCGTMITTQDNLMQNYMEEIKRLNDLAIRDRRNRAVYQQQASQLTKIANQILHATTQMEEKQRNLQNELSVLVFYVRENGLVSDDKLSELRDKGRERARKKSEEDEKLLEQLYGNFNSILASSSRRDPVEKAVLKKGR
jgi:hypothetical protein